MGTFVTIHVVGPAAGHKSEAQSPMLREEAVERAFAWFDRVEECCTRFDSGSEVMRLAAQAGVPVPVSTLLYEAVQFALAVAEESGGAFDPTVGYAMETRGFDREYRSGRQIRTALDCGRTSLDCGRSVSYRDVRLDPERKTITLLRPLVIDLGAVAKGLAVDLAARELSPFENFAINAGGDLYLGGRNPDSEPWSIGIRHPRQRHRSDRGRPRVEPRRLHLRRLRKAQRRWRSSHSRSAHRSLSQWRGQRDRHRSDRDAGGCPGNGGFRFGPGGWDPAL